MSLLDATSRYERQEPFFVVALAAGDQFIFRNPSTRLEFDSIRQAATEFATLVREGRAGDALEPYRFASPATLEVVAILSRLFVKATFPDGENEPQVIESVSQAEWLELSEKRWQLFETIRDGVNQQVSERGMLLRVQALDDAKKKSNPTPSSEKNSEPPCECGADTPPN